jgi:hypothetical protein
MHQIIRLQDLMLFHREWHVLLKEYRTLLYNSSCALTRWLLWKEIIQLKLELKTIEAEMLVFVNEQLIQSLTTNCCKN